MNYRKLRLYTVRLLLLTLFIAVLSATVNPILAVPTFEPRLSPPHLTTRFKFTPELANPGDTVEMTVDIANLGMLAADGYDFSLELADALSLARGAEATAELATVSDDAPQQLSFFFTVSEGAVGYQPISLIIRDRQGDVAAAAYERLLVIDPNAPESMTESEPEEPSGWIFKPIEPVPSLFAGSLNYNVPFETPPARGGVGPNLALNYSSRTVDGTKGYHDSNKYGEGWSLSGLPFIARNNVRHCGGENPDYFLCAGDVNSQVMANDFTLHMNGSHQLTYLGSCAGIADCDLYEAEDAPELQVRHYRDGASNKTDQYWLVRMPNGQEYQFGFWEDSEQILFRSRSSNDPDNQEGWPVTGSIDKVAAYRWYLDRVDDPFGNRMVVKYANLAAAGSAMGPNCNHNYVCRELDVWPSQILYNNNTFPPNRTDETLWDSKIEFGWTAPITPSFDDPTIFVTALNLQDIAMYQRVSGTWAEMWHYDVMINDYPCYDVYDPENPFPPGDPDTYHCDNGSHIRILSSLQRVEGSGEVWPATTFSYFGQQAGLSGYNEAKIVGQVCFQYVGNDCAPTGWHDVRYPHLKLLDNGYGGVYKFTYEDLQMHNRAKSRYVKKVEVWDGVDKVYGVNSNPTFYTTYAPTGPCYDDDGACHDGPEGASGKLVGFEDVVVKSYNGSGNFLTRSDYHFLVPGNGGNHPLLWGKEESRAQFADVGGTDIVTQTIMEWLLIGTHYYCPSKGFAEEWVCLYSATNEFYEYTNSTTALSYATRELYRYNPDNQLDPNGTVGGRQWGIRTQTEYGYMDDDTFIRTHLSQNNYVTNESIAQWVARPRATGVWTTAWVPLQISLSFYGDEIDSDNQTVNRNDQLTWTRAIVAPEWLPSGTTTTWKTVDTYYAYGNYGHLEGIKTFDEEGQQGLYVHSSNGDWHPSTDLDPNRPGAMVDFTYDALGLLIQSVKNPLDHETIYDYGGVNVYPWQITNKTLPAAALETEYRYDDWGRLATTIGPEATVGNPSLTYDYLLPAGGPVRITQTVNPGLDESVSRATVTQYDGLGRALETRVDGPGSTELVTVVKYDGLSRVICQSVPVQVVAGAAAPACDVTTTPHTTTIYDAAGRVIQVTLPDGTATTTTYAASGMSSWVGDGYLALAGATQTKTVNAEGGTTYHTYDDRGRLRWIGEMDEDATCANGRIFITLYNYDEVGNLTNVERGSDLCSATYTDSDVINTAISYDGLGRKTEMTDPDMGVWQYFYDPAGNITRQIGGAGSPDEVTTCSEYDQLNRLTDQWLGSSGTCGSIPSLGDPTFLAHYEYVTNTNNPGLGQIASVVWDPHTPGINGSFSDVFTYDSLGRLETQTRTLNHRVYAQTTLEYDRLHRPLRVLNPVGEEVVTDYEYWGADSLEVAGTNLVSSVGYNTRGQMISLARNNGVNTTYAYDEANFSFRLEQITTTNTSGSLLSFDYTYDDIGQIATWDTVVAGMPFPHQREYKYDKIGRLTNVSNGLYGSGSWGQDYGYDNLGNLESMTTLNPGINDNVYVTYVRDASHPHAVGQRIEDHEAGSMYTSNYGYNTLGHMTYREDNQAGVSLTYDQVFDELGRLTAVTKTEGGNSTATLFAYDTNGLRVLTVHEDGTLVYDPFPGYEEEIQNLPDPPEVLAVYVDADYTGPENGTMTQPFNTINEALTIVASGMTIHVGAGTYNEAIVIPAHITLIGGYQQTGNGVNWNVNDPWAYPSILTDQQPHSGTGGESTVWLAGANAQLIGFKLVGNGLLDRGITVLDPASEALVSNVYVDGYHIAVFGFADSTVEWSLMTNNDYGTWYQSTATVEIVHNTIVGTGNGSGVYAGEGPTATLVMDVYDNIVTSNGFGIRVYNGSPTVNATFNDVWGNNTNYSGVAAGTGSISADPLFADAANGDYRLIENSPAVGAASDGENMGAFANTIFIPDPPSSLTAIYSGSSPDLQEEGRGPVPPSEYVDLNWAHSATPGTITFNVYRHTSQPVPIDAAHRIASYLTLSTYRDLNGQLGNYYVVTAENLAGESGPSNTAQAAPEEPCNPPVCPTGTEGMAGTQTLLVGNRLVGEVGWIDDTLTDTEQTISLLLTYTNPVVFAQPISRDGTDTAVVRITDVQSNSFTLKVHEIGGGAHGTEAVSYIVLEAGQWALPNGTLLEVGRQTIATSVGVGVNNLWSQVRFVSDFTSTPVIISQVQTNNDTSWVKTRQDDRAANGFAVALEQEDSDSNPHGSEVVGWLAIEPGTGGWNGHLYEANNTADAVTHNWYQLNFAQTFNEAPRFVAGLATYDGGDGAAVRYNRTSLNANGVQVMVEEDTTDDPETSHTSEIVAFLAIEGNGLLTAADGSIVVRRVTYNLGGQAIAIQVSGSPDPDSNGLFYLHTDHLGSTRAMTDEAGELVADSVTFFTPFGSYELGAPATNPAITDRGYTGHQHNDDLGLIYMNARFYAPYLNRFLSADTIVPDPTNPQSFNRYSYVNNRPLNFNDPTGHNSEDPLEQDKCALLPECHSSGGEQFYLDVQDLPTQNVAFTAWLILQEARDLDSPVKEALVSYLESAYNLYDPELNEAMLSMYATYNEIDLGARFTEWSEYVDERKDQEVEAFRKSMLDAGTSESEAALGAQAVDLLLGPVEGTVRVLLMGGASVEALGKGVGKSIGMGLPLTDLLVRQAVHSHNANSLRTQIEQHWEEGTLR